MADKYRLQSSHAEDLADGRVVAPGEEVTQVQTDHPHNARLISEGRLVKIESQQASESKTAKTPADDKKKKEDN